MYVVRYTRYTQCSTIIGKNIVKQLVCASAYIISHTHLWSVQWTLSQICKLNLFGFFFKEERDWYDYFRYVHGYVHLLLLAAFNIDNRSSSFYFCCGFLLQFDENYFYFFSRNVFLSSECGSVIIYAMKWNLSFSCFQQKECAQRSKWDFSEVFWNTFLHFSFLDEFEMHTYTSRAMTYLCEWCFPVKYTIYISSLFFGYVFYSMCHNRFIQCNVIKMCIASVCNSIDVSTLKLNLKYFVHSFRFSNALFKILLLFFRFFASNLLNIIRRREKFLNSTVFFL